VSVQDNSALPGNGISLPASSVKGSNTPGWLQRIMVPMLGPVATGVLAIVLLVSGQRWLPARRARTTPSDAPRAYTAVRSRRPA
jgi:hypothetical protein